MRVCVLHITLLFHTFPTRFPFTLCGTRRGVYVAYARDRGKAGRLVEQTSKSWGLLNFMQMRVSSTTALSSQSGHRSLLCSIPWMVSPYTCFIIGRIRMESMKTVSLSKTMQKKLMGAVEWFPCIYYRDSGWRKWVVWRRLRAELMSFPEIIRLSMLFPFMLYNKIARSEKKPWLWL